MRCFNHPTVDALGSCRHCARGLCRECIAEVNGLVACKSRCEKDVEEGYKVLLRSRTVHAKQALLMQRNAAIYVIFGAILIFTSGGPLDSAFGRVLFAIGALFIGMGVWSFVLARRYASDDPATRPSATA